MLFWICFWYCCILSKFYIKPQLSVGSLFFRLVVSYRNSTSNHNYPDYLHYTGSVVSYRNSTSNHNSSRLVHRRLLVVSYRNSTSNHNQARRNWKYKKLYLIEILHQTTTLHIFHKGPEMLYLIEILHQTTTRPQLLCLQSVLYLIEILHQTTTSGDGWGSTQSCILSKFYIKPQLYGMS